MSTRHTLSVPVENEPGVLTRAAAFFACRALNIHSLAIGKTEGPCISRMIVVVNAVELPIEQVTRQLNKLVNALKIVEPDSAAAIERQLLLIKVSANDPSRADVFQIVDLFRAHVVDVVPDAVTVKATGPGAKVEAFLAALGPYGIWEMIQSGVVATTRGARLPSERAAAELN